MAKVDLASIKRLIDPPKNPDALYIFLTVVLNRNYLRKEPHQAVCRFVQKNFLKRRWCQLIMPRGFLKTTICSEGAPLLFGLFHPEETYLLIRNTMDNARGSLRVIRSYLEKNNLLRALFPDVVPNLSHDHVKWSDSQVELLRKEKLPQPTFEVAGVGTTLTGRHYGTIIADDLLAARENPDSGELYEPTRDDIDRANSWLDRMFPLFQDPQHSFFMNATTRWCPDDTVAHIQNWPKVKDNILVVDAINPAGEPTYERFPLSILDQIKQSMGDYLFSALYRNQPLSSTSRVFQPQWFKYMPIEWRSPPENINFYMGVDPAGTDKKASDFFAAIVVGVDNSSNWYIVEYINERIGNNLREQARRLVSLIRKWRVEAVALETNFWRGQLQDALQEELDQQGVWTQIAPVKATAASGLSKDSRILWLQPLFEAGKIYMKHDMAALEHQLKAWRPNSATLKHDDLIDALAWIKVVADSPKVPLERPKLLDFNSWDYVKLEVEANRRNSSSANDYKYRLMGAQPTPVKLPAPDRI